MRLLSTFNFGYSGQMRRNYFYQIYPLRLSVVKLSAISQDFLNTLYSYPYLWDTFEDQIDAGVGFMLYHTTDPAVVPKTSYHSERISLDLSGNVLSLLNPVLPDYPHPAVKMHSIFGLPYKQYVRGEVNLSRVFRLGWNDSQAFAMHLVAGAGIAYGNSVAMPFEKQFYCGGANSMRGWQARTLGPGAEQMDDSFRIPSQTGNLKLEADIEYRFPAFWKLEGAVFAEAGNVWEMASTPVSWDTVAADWGVGLRVNLDFILIRLDAGFRVHDPARAAGERWVHPRDWLHGSAAIHFGVGYPF